MEITRKQRRALIELACRVAWADGAVADGERAFVQGMVQRFAREAVDDAELQAWLAHPPSDEEFEALPRGLDQLFIYEAMQLMESDGDIDDDELALMQKIINRLFDDKPEGTPLAKIAVQWKELRAAREDQQ